MRALSADEIRGTWGTVLLPIRDDDSLDLDELSREVDSMVAAGLSGLYTNGTAGEFHTQTDDEFLEVNRVVAAACTAAGVPFQVGASHPCAQTSLARVKAARHLEPGAYQVILPDWVAVTDEEAIAFLKGIAHAAEGIGLVLYNPPHAKRALAVETIARLKEAVPTLVGVKVADGNASWYGAVRARLGGLSVFVPGHHLATGLAHGAHGSYSNVACLSPKGAVRWGEQALTDPGAALALQHKIVAFLQARVTPYALTGYSNPALDKFLAAIGGWARIGTRLRWPYNFIPQEEAERLRDAARTAVPELFPEVAQA